MCIGSHTASCGTLTTTRCHPRHASRRSFNGFKWSTVRSAKITAALSDATTIIGPQVGFTPEDVSALSMRSGVAMVLLISQVNTDTIRLVDRWRSDIILCYLHTAAQKFTEGLAARMVQHGDYALIPPAHGD